jgi:hypothetical protein
MKKFNRRIHKTMGSLPPQLFKYFDMADIKAATDEFNAFITSIANEFHSKLENFSCQNDIKLSAPNLFDQPVKLKYVASGSVGSVYKLKIGNETFALKINRSSAFGEMDVMSLQKRAKNLLNHAYIGSVFEHNGRKYSWVISDYVANDTARSFEDAMIKMYFAYLTKGIIVRDTHPGNIKGGKIIDIPSFDMRDGAIDDIKQLNLRQIDIVKKLVNFIKIDNVDAFQKLVNRIKVSDPIIIQYMFFAMKFGRAPALSLNAKEFFAKIKRYESVINIAKKELNTQHISESNVR